MPEKRTLQRARKDKKEGKAASTQAGEFVREEMDHVKEGKHGVASRKQAIAIGLSKARRAGVKLGPPKKGKASAATRKKASQDLRAGHAKKKTTARKRTTTKRGATKRTTAKRSSGRKTTSRSR